MQLKIYINYYYKFCETATSKTVFLFAAAVNTDLMLAAVLFSE